MHEDEDAGRNAGQEQKHHENDVEDAHGYRLSHVPPCSTSIFTIDAETSSITSFKMKDCTIPELIWNVKIENGQLTIDQNV